MNTIPRSKFRSFHVRCSISPFRIPVSRIVENSRRSSSRQAAKNFRISSDVMNRGSDRFGTRNFSMFVHRIYEEMILLDGPTEEREETPQLVVDGPHRDARMNGMCLPSHPYFAFAFIVRRFGLR